MQLTPYLMTQTKLEDWKEESTKLGFKVCKLTDDELCAFRKGWDQLNPKKFFADMDKHIVPVLLQIQKNNDCQTDRHDTVLVIDMEGTLQGWLLGRPKKVVAA